MTADEVRRFHEIRDALQSFCDVLEFLGAGTFGVVVKAKLRAGDLVA